MKPKILCALLLHHPGVVRALLAAAPDIERNEREGLHPLGLAAVQGRLACLQALLDSGFAAGQEQFEGAESYAKWRFSVSAGSFIGRALPLPDKANGG